MALGKPLSRGREQVAVYPHIEVHVPPAAVFHAAFLGRWHRDPGSSRPHAVLQGKQHEARRV